jgi:primosomal protein N''
MAGRPTKYDAERAERILSALRAGNTRKAACAFGAISDETFANWCRRYLEFLEAVRKAESDAEVRRVANIAKAGNEGDWRADAWWLERRRHQDWGRKDRIELVTAVRLLAQQEGLTEEETTLAVQEAERYVKELQHAGGR